MIVLIDNYDSFTYNLYQYLCMLDVEVLVYRNDEITLQQLEKLHPAAIVISPGPCTPNESGISLDVINHFKEKLPLLGICLGHQAIAQHFGAKIIHAPEPIHGKTSMVVHCNTSLFVDVPNPVRVTRYHSLAIDPSTLPNCLAATAWTQTENGEREIIMGIQHKTLPIAGVQFHPESILTECGLQLLKNFFNSYLS